MRKRKCISHPSLTTYVIITILALITITSYPKLIHLENAQQLEDLAKTNKYLCLKFYADWCGPCKAVKDHFKNVAENKELEKVAFVEVDIDKHLDVAKKYDAKSIPMFVYIADNTVVDNDLGAGVISLFEKTLTEKLKNLFSLGTPEAPTSLEKGPEKTAVEKASQKPADCGCPLCGCPIICKIKQFFVDSWNWIKKLFGA